MTERTPQRTKAMQAAGEYWIVLCANCRHPGGAHVIDQWEPRVTHCKCCPDCPAYIDGDYGRWQLPGDTPATAEQPEPGTSRP